MGENRRYGARRACDQKTMAGSEYGSLDYIRGKVRLDLRGVDYDVPAERIADTTYPQLLEVIDWLKKAYDDDDECPPAPDWLQRYDSSARGDES